MKFGAWSYTGFYVDLRQADDNGTTVEVKENGMDLSFFYKSAEWDLLSLRSERHSVLYASCCGPEKYVDITYYFVLRRKTLFFTCNLIMPCFLISFLTTFVFLLSHHKITFSISILVTLTVFFLVLIDIMPPTSLVIPMFGRYLITTMVLVALSTIVSVITVNFRFRSGAAHIMSPWTKTVFMKLLPKLLFIKRPEKVERAVRRPSAVPHVATELFAGAANLFGPSGSLPKTKFGSKEAKEYLSKRPSMAPPSYMSYRTPSIGYSHDSLEAIPPPRMMSTSFNGPIPGNSVGFTETGVKFERSMNGTHSLPHSIQKQMTRRKSQQQVEEEQRKTRKKVNDLILAKLLQQVKLIAEHFRRYQEEMEISDDWVFVATVLDRLFLWIFGLMNVATLWIILESPSLYDDREPLNISFPTKPLGQADVYSILNNKFR
uniref:Neur_chan_memb domain-containing protein n=2 Tax=Bursaphelenchus xylophilus TaxID=6326 RepID=A0A1I7SB01_BURXY